MTAHANGEIILWDLAKGIRKFNFGNYDTEVFSLENRLDVYMVYSGCRFSLLSPDKLS